MAAKLGLVVIGNGMAGARTIEEIPARDGGKMFDIAILGDEAFDNYDRIIVFVGVEKWGSA